MAVMLETSLGEIVVDLFTGECPITTKNFLKLCKMKYYNNCLFHDVKKDFLAQTGDPSGSGKGGDSLYKFLYGDQARFFEDEIRPKLKHAKKGTVAMASAGENLNASQFYITLRDDLDYLDEKHTVFGEVGEGFDVLDRINETFVDESGRPFKNIRIKHTHVLDDPFADPPGLEALIPDRSPEFVPEEGAEVRLEEDWVPMEETMDEEELVKTIREKEAHGRAVVLEMIGDLPEADVKPPENVLFICKLNPVTQEDDLEIIFSRFGKIVSADIIRDFKTGDSLCYGFIEFENKEACEAAYFKMDNVLIDDRRIHVDFSQSVGKLWNRYKKIGTKDSADAGGSSYAPGAARSKGCFNCGQEGHMAKDCPEPKGGGPNAPPKARRVELKERGVRQIGGASEKYDMVFDDGAGYRGPPDYEKRPGAYDKRASDHDRRGSGDGRRQAEYDKRPSGYDKQGDRKRRREGLEEDDKRGERKQGESREGGGSHREDRETRGVGGDRRTINPRDEYSHREERGGRSQREEGRGRDDKRSKNGHESGREDRGERAEPKRERERSYEGRSRDGLRSKEHREEERRIEEPKRRHEREKHDDRKDEGRERKGERGPRESERDARRYDEEGRHKRRNR